MQILSQTTGYAVLALSYLHGHEDEWVLAKDIAVATGVPGPYLSRILHQLGKSGLILTKRGYKGGVRLSRPAEDITLLEVAETIEPNVREPRCVLGLGECTDDRGCPAHEVWVKEQASIRNLLKTMTLAEVAKFERREDGRLKDALVKPRPERRPRTKKAK